VVDFPTFLRGEARSYAVALARLSAEMEDLGRVDGLFQALPKETRAVPGGVDWVRYLGAACQARLYTSTLAYMRGQRGDMDGITRWAVEAAINAVLLHKGILTPETFDEGGTAILKLYRGVNSENHKDHVPKLKYLYDTRAKLSGRGSHAEMASIIFRVTEGPEAGETRFHFFEAAADDGEYRYTFLSNLVHYTDVLSAFGYIGSESGEPWAAEFQRRVMGLRASLAGKANRLEVPEVFGDILDEPDWAPGG
jgi:hypothetical protein